MAGSNSNRIRNRPPREIPRVIVGEVVEIVAVGVEVEMVTVKVVAEVSVIIIANMQSPFVNHA